MPQPLLNQRGPAASASNTSQYSGRAWGSQPPESGMFLPCCFAFLAGYRLVTRKARNTPMTRHSYREHDYAFGQAMLKLRTSIGLTKAGLAHPLGVSPRAVGEWEADSNYLKPNTSNTFLGCVCSSTSLRRSGRKRKSGRCGKRLINGYSSMKPGSMTCLLLLRPFNFPHRPRRRLPTRKRSLQPPRASIG